MLSYHLVYGLIDKPITEVLECSAVPVLSSECPEIESAENEGSASWLYFKRSLVTTEFEWSHH